MISFADVCDAAFLITSTVKYARYENAKNELHRVGIHDFRTVCDAPSAYKDFLYSAFKRENRLNRWVRENKSAFLVTLSHYAAISQAYHTGSERALFMEDDICFLREQDEISEILSGLPPSADIVLFDHNGERDLPKYTQSLDDARRQNEKFIKFPCDVRTATCYLLSRAGMKYVLNLMNPLANRRVYHNDRYWDVKYWKPGTAFIAVTPPAFQRPFSGVATNSTSKALATYATIRERIGIPLEKYNISQEQLDIYRRNAS